MSTALTGKGVLLTRPAGQASRLAQRLAELGATPILFPAIEIAPPTDLAAVLAIIDRLHDFDLAVFISPSAAETALALIRARRALPPGLRVAAVGEGTARALRRLGFDEVIVPSAGADSESLLALPEMHDVAGRRIVVFRGEGGREQLAQTLRARGATVEHADCYRRQRPSADPGPVLGHWAAGRIHAAVVGSREALDNLFALLGPEGAAYLRQSPVFVPHERIADYARGQGVHNAIVHAPGETALIAALCAYFDERDRQA